MSSDVSDTPTVAQDREWVAQAQKTISKRTRILIDLANDNIDLRERLETRVKELEAFISWLGVGDFQKDGDGWIVRWDREPRR
jgi:hypothetical protein